MDKEQKHTYNNKGNREEKPRLLSRLEFRLFPIDKNRIRGQKKRYGLTVGEYIRCRALSIAPPPEYHPLDCFRHYYKLEKGMPLK